MSTGLFFRVWEHFLGTGEMNSPQQGRRESEFARLVVSLRNTTTKLTPSFPTTNPMRLDTPIEDCSPAPLPLASHENAIDELRSAGALFYNRGWSVGTSSNYSLVLQRDPLELVVTASGMDKGRLLRADFVRVAADGAPTEPDQPKSSAETLLHCVAAQQPNVGAVLHTHSIWATLLSEHYFEDGGFDMTGFEMLKGLAGIKTHEATFRVEIFDNTQDIPSLAAAVSERLNDSANPLTHGYLIRRHGLYTWGADVDEARRHIEIFEFLFESVARSLMLQGRLAGSLQGIAEK